MKTQVATCKYCRHDENTHNLWPYWTYPTFLFLKFWLLNMRDHAFGLNHGYVYEEVASENLAFVPN